MMSPTTGYPQLFTTKNGTPKSAPLQGKFKFSFLKTQDKNVEVKPKKILLRETDITLQAPRFPHHTEKHQRLD